MWEQHMVLEDETHRATLRGLIHALPGHPSPVEQDLPRLQPLQPGSKPQQRALAASRWAEQAGDCAGFDGEIDVPQHGLRRRRHG